MENKNIETPRQREAFEYYYSLGSVRSFNKTASFVGVSVQSIKNWSERFDWKQRVIERDRELYKEVEDKKDDDFIVEMEANRKVIRASLADFIKRLKNGEVKVNRIKDAVDLMKLDAQYVEIILSLKARMDEGKEINIDNSISFELLNKEDDDSNTMNNSNEQ